MWMYRVSRAAVDAQLHYKASSHDVDVQSEQSCSRCTTSLHRCWCTERAELQSMHNFAGKRLALMLIYRASRAVVDAQLQCKASSPHVGVRSAQSSSRCTTFAVPPLMLMYRASRAAVHAQLHCEPSSPDVDLQTEQSCSRCTTSLQSVLMYRASRAAVDAQLHCKASAPDVDVQSEQSCRRCTTSLQSVFCWCGCAEWVELQSMHKLHCKASSPDVDVQSEQSCCRCTTSVQSVLPWCWCTDRAELQSMHNVTTKRHPWCGCTERAEVQSVHNFTAQMLMYRASRAAVDAQLRCQASCPDVDLQSEQSCSRCTTSVQSVFPSCWCTERAELQSMHNVTAKRPPLMLMYRGSRAAVHAQLHCEPSSPDVDLQTEQSCRRCTTSLQSVLMYRASRAAVDVQLHCKASSPDVDVQSGQSCSRCTTSVQSVLPWCWCTERAELQSMHNFAGKLLALMLIYRANRAVVDAQLQCKASSPHVGVRSAQSCSRCKTLLRSVLPWCWCTERAELQSMHNFTANPSSPDVDLQTEQSCSRCTTSLQSVLMYRASRSAVDAQLHCKACSPDVDVQSEQSCSRCTTSLQSVLMYRASRAAVDAQLHCKASSPDVDVQSEQSCSRCTTSLHRCWCTERAELQSMHNFAGKRLPMMLMYRASRAAVGAQLHCTDVDVQREQSCSRCTTSLASVLPWCWFTERVELQSMPNFTKKRLPLMLIYRASRAAVGAQLHCTDVDVQREQSCSRCTTSLASVLPWCWFTERVEL